MGLNASLWREGDVAVMEVTLGRAFEGAPGRAHGGIVAALLDETMGLVHVINESARLHRTVGHHLCRTDAGRGTDHRAGVARAPRRSQTLHRGVTSVRRRHLVACAALSSSRSTRDVRTSPVDRHGVVACRSRCSAGSRRAKCPTSRPSFGFLKILTTAMGEATSDYFVIDSPRSGGARDGRRLLRRALVPITVAHRIAPPPTGPPLSW